MSIKELNQFLTNNQLTTKDYLSLFNHTHIIAFLFFISALLLRLYRFSEYPIKNGFGFEEHQTAELALLFMQYKFITLEHFITNSITALSFFLFGPSSLALRMPFVIASALSILVMYYLARELAKPFPAFVATFFFLVSHWYILGGRFADELFTGILILLLMLLTTIKALKKEKIILFCLSGLFSGLLMYEYLGYRIGPIFITTLIIFSAIRHMRKKNYKKVIFITASFFISFGLIITPLVISTHTGNDVLIEGFRRHANDRVGGGYTPLEVLVQSHKTSILPNSHESILRIQESFGVFVNKPKGVLELAPNLPLLDFITVLFLVVGFVATILKIKKQYRFVIFSWFVSSFFIAAIFPVNFYAGRFSTILPLIFIIILFGVEMIYQRASQHKHVFSVVIVLLSIGMLASLYVNMSILASSNILTQSTKIRLTKKEASGYCDSNELRGWLCTYSKTK